MKCDYCDNEENVATISDRIGEEADVHICRDCYAVGVEPKLSAQEEA